MVGSSSCYVPGCNTGRASDRKHRKLEGKKVLSLFAVPREEELLKKWKEAIPMASRELKETDRVCQLHFLEEEIDRYFVATFPDGSVQKLERANLTLRKGAIPSIFPSLPLNSPERKQGMAEGNTVRDSKRKLPTDRGIFEPVDKFIFVPETEDEIEEKERNVDIENISNNSSFVSVNLKNNSSNLFSTAYNELKPRSACTYSQKKLQNGKRIKFSDTGILPTDTDGDSQIRPINILPVEQNDEEAEIRPIRILSTEQNDEETDIRPVRVFPTEQTDKETEMRTIRVLPTEQNDKKTEMSTITILCIEPNIKEAELRTIRILPIEQNDKKTEIRTLHTEQNNKGAVLKPVTILLAKKQDIETTNKWSFISNVMHNSQEKYTEVDMDTNNLLSAPKHYQGNTNIECSVKWNPFDFRSLCRNVKLLKMPYDWSITHGKKYLIFAKWTSDSVPDRRILINHDLNVKVFLRDILIDVPEDKKIDSMKDVTDLLNEVHSFNLCSGIQAPGLEKEKCLLFLTKKMGLSGNFSKICVHCRRMKKRLRNKIQPICQNEPKCKKCTHLNNKVKTLKEQVAHLKKRCAFLRKSILACDQT